MKYLFSTILLVTLSLSALAQPPKAQFKAGKIGHVAKVLAFPALHLVRTTKAVSKAAVLAPYDTLEAGVDALGLAIEAFGGVVQGVGQGLESLPKPLYYIGDVLDYSGGYANKAGVYLAQ